MRGTDANDEGHMMGGLDVQPFTGGSIGNAQVPLEHVAVTSHVRSGLVPHSHVSPLS
jgi:hypothetical protein